MMENLRPQFRAVLALFLLLVVLGALSALLAPIAERWSAKSAEIEETRSLLGRFEAMAAKSDAAASMIAGAASLLSGGELLRPEATSAASARLQTQLRAIAAQNAVELPIVRPLPAETVQGLTRIGLRVSLSGDLPSMMRAVHKIESNVPYLIIDNLELRPARGAATGGLPVEASFDVVGFMIETRS